MDDILQDVISRCVVRLDPVSRDLPALVAELVGAAVDDGVLPADQRDAAIEAVLRREQSASTVLPDGIAFPHGRTDCVAQTVAVLGVHRCGLDLGAPGGDPTCLTVLMLVPISAGNAHVQLLARLSRRLLDAVVRERLRAVDSADQVRQLLVS